MRNHTWVRLARFMGFSMLCMATIRFAFYPPVAPAHQEDHEEQAAPSCSVLGWIPYWDQRRAIASLRRNIDTIDYVSLFWYALGPDGEIIEYQDAEIERELIAFARENDVKVFALVANLPDDQREGDSDWDPVRVGALIADADRRSAHIEALVNLSDELEVDGINIDYEALPEEQRSDFTIFIRELAEALHAKNKLLAVALHPKTSETNPAEDNGSHAQDWEELAKYADQLHLMTYGEHHSGTHPGPIASPDWVEPVVRYAREVREVSAEKLFLGIPLYAEAWEPVDSGGFRGSRVDLTFKDIKRVQRKYAGSRLSNDRYDNPSFVFESGKGDKRIVWFENGTSVQRKLLVGAKFGICNFAFWRLGGEDPRVWAKVKRAVNADR